MTSYGSVPIDYSLNQRRLPRSQVERIPTVDDWEDDDGSGRDDVDGADGEHEVGSLASSLRANFLPPSARLLSATDPAFERYKSIGSPSPGSSFLSPVFSHLPSVKPSRLTVASDDAQRLRRKLLRGANLLVVQGGYSGKRFIYERLKELGVAVTIMDGPDTVWRAAAEEGLIAEFIEIDFTEHDTVFQRAMDILLSLELTFDGVTTFYEEAVSLAARVATALGVETNPVSACDQARNKRITRQVMANCGLPVPRFSSVRTEEDLLSACELVGFPAILKPVFGLASMGVTRVNEKEAALVAYRKIAESIATSSESLWAQGTELVLEEFYDGDEFDIDVLLSDGKVVYSKVSDNWACWEPWFQETGTNCPSMYPADRQADLVKLAIDSTLALGFRAGAFHVECKYTSRGPRLIEVNARMGGVSVRDANLRAWGVDMVEEHAMSALKIPIRPVVAKTPMVYFAETAINAPYSGTVTSSTWLEEILSVPMVHKVNYFKREGDVVQGPADGVPDWLAEVIVVSTTSASDAVSCIREVVRDLRVPIEAKEPGSERGWFFPDHAYPFAEAVDLKV